MRSELNKRQARLPRRVAQEFKVQAGGSDRSELGRSSDGSTQAGIRCLKRRVSESPPCADAFAARDHTRERKEEGKEKEGEWVARALYGLPVSSSSDPPRAPDRAPLGYLHVWYGSGGIRVLHADNAKEGGVGSRELETSAVCRISTSTKPGLLIR
jgi:hypothetical protein